MKPVSRRRNLCLVSTKGGADRHVDEYSFPADTEGQAALKGEIARLAAASRNGPSEAVLAASERA